MTPSSAFTFASAAANLGLSAIAIKPKRGFYKMQRPDGTPFIQGELNSGSSGAGGLSSTADGTDVQSNPALALDNPNNIIIPNVTINERSIHRSHITHHPVQQGSTINDHVYRMPTEVILTISWSNSPQATPTEQLALDLASFLAAENSTINALGNAIGEIYAISKIAQAMFSGSGSTALQGYYGQLVDLKDSFCLFDLYTGKRTYKNMIIKMLSNETDFRTENCLPITCECQELILVNTSTVAIPKSNVSPNTPGVEGTVNIGELKLDQHSPG